MITHLFTEIQSTTSIVGAEDTFYAVFNTPENSIAGSAVCSFSLSDVTKTFEESPFKNQVRKYSNLLKGRTDTTSPITDTGLSASPATVQLQ